MAQATEEQESAAAKGGGDEAGKLSLARKRFTRAHEAVQANRTEAREVRSFLWLDEQWGPGNALATERSSRNQSSITVNELKGLYHQVVNDQRQNRTAPRVVPVDDGADPEVARVLTGLMRRILAGSGVGPPADAALDTAHGHAVDGGEGFFVLETEWEDAKGTMLCLRVARVDDPETVLLDPEAREADFSDARYGFWSQWMDWEVVQERWPTARKVDFEEAWGGTRELWEKDDMVRVCRYRYVAETPPPEGKGRPARTVYDCLLTGAEILEETEFPCQWIAMFCVTGDWVRIGGEIHTSGLFHSARGPQMMLNYYRSSLADAVGEIPKTRFMATPEQIKGYETHYENVAKNPQSVLLYNVDPGAPEAMPKQLTYTADVSALVTGGQLMREDIERVTGMFAAGRGEEGNERSGKALLARQHETDTATFHYADNLNRAQQYLGRCIVDAIPRVYMGEGDVRPTRILEEDGSDRVVYFRQNEGDLPIVREEVTGPLDHATEPRLRKGERLEDGDRRMFTYIDPDVGRYDVQIATGPNFSTKRRENAEALLELATAAAGPDYLVLRYMAADNMDWEGADTYKDALLAMMDGPTQEVLRGSGGEMDPKRELSRARAQLGQAQQQMAQAEQIIQELMTRLQAAQDAATDTEREAMVKLAVQEMRRDWEHYEADQATLRTAIQSAAKGGEVGAARGTTGGAAPAAPALGMNDPQGGPMAFTPGGAMGPGGLRGEG